MRLRKQSTRYYYRKSFFRIDEVDSAQHLALWVYLLDNDGEHEIDHKFIAYDRKDGMWYEDGHRVGYKEPALYHKVAVIRRCGEMLIP